LARKNDAVHEPSPTTTPVSNWLRDWLTAAEVGTEPYSRSDFTEQARPPNIAEQLAVMLMDAKSDLELTKRLLDRLGWTRAGVRLRPSHRIQARHGDFGEVLTLGLLREFWGRTVPVVKLRVQMDPEQSLHGTDLVGFSLLPVKIGNVIDTLEFVETKVRVGVDNRSAVEAHSQLHDDREKSFADTLDFVHQQLSRIDSDLLSAFEDYLADRRDGELGCYRICLVYDRDAWREEVLGALPEELVLPLSVDVVMIEELRSLIDAAWSAVGADRIAG